VELSHFTYGWVNPVMAFGISYIGSLLGLLCTARARRQTADAHPVRWLVLASVAIGGSGIWLMHFMAMLGFTVVGQDVRYNVPLTIASALAAVGVVGVGLFTVGTGRPTALRLLGGGLLTGIGVAIMHYMGMAAMRVGGGEIAYRPDLVIASVVIAVVAATVALWFTVVAARPVTITLAALIMGIAVCGMHYTGMAALKVHDHVGGRLTGADPFQLLMPVILLVGIVMIVVLYAVLTAPEDMTSEPRRPVRV
jgi:NO-binding membrane sensor protein with MHYT domain